MASSGSLLMALLALGLVGALVDQPLENKIVGGEEVDISKFPWQAALLLNGKCICGGTIISDHWVLSAAHCVKDKSLKSLNLRVGSNKHDTGGQTYQVKTSVVHADFNSSTVHNDISAMKTSSRIVFSDEVASAKLPAPDRPPEAVGSDLWVSGWGRTSKVDKLSPNLMAVEIKILNFILCKILYNALKPSEDHQVCTGLGGRDSCNGDSGGPLVKDDVLVGIVSYGPKVCGTLPGVYTRVSAYRDWIKKITGL